MEVIEMRKKLILLLLSVALLNFLAVDGMAQKMEKLTEEESMELIAGYQQRADAAQAMIDKEQGKIDELREMIRDLDQKIVACEEKLAMQGGMDTYTVVRGDWLAKLAEYDDVYGHGYYARWIEIYRANRDIIGDNPNRIYPGQVYNIPRP